MAPGSGLIIASITPDPRSVVFGGVLGVDGAGDGAGFADIELILVA